MKPLAAGKHSRMIRIARMTRGQAGRVWVRGTIMQFRFTALVHSEPVTFPDFEIERSRISKLCLTRRADDVMIYCWDCGLEDPCFDSDAEHALRTICDALAAVVDRALAN